MERGRRFATAADRNTALIQRLTAKLLAVRSSAHAKMPGMAFGSGSPSLRHLYPGIPDLLRRAKPRGELLFDKESWPDENDAMEDSLRTALVRCRCDEACRSAATIEELETEHGPRRGWAWARLGLCPLAKATGASGNAGHADRDDVWGATPPRRWPSCTPRAGISRTMRHCGL